MKATHAVGIAAGLSAMLWASAVHAGAPVQIQGCGGSALADLQAAVADAGVTQIQLKTAGCVFSGTMGARDSEVPLKVDANGATFKLASGEIGLFSSGAGDIKIMRANFVRAVDDVGFDHGILLEVPGDASGEIVLEVVQVLVDGADLHGLYLDDLTNASDASVKLLVESSRFVNNGFSQNDQDGVRVDERADGSITAVIHHSVVDRNSSDGLELDEAGTGDVALQSYRSTYNDNGENPNCAAGLTEEEALELCPDPDDGVDIDEADDGTIFATVRASEILGNDLDEDEINIDMDEDDAGDDGLLTLDHVAYGDAANLELDDVDLIELP